MNSRKVKAIDNEIEALHDQIVELKRERAGLVKKWAAHFKLKCVYEITLTEDEIWSDNDAPPNPSAADVREVMDSYGLPDVVLQEWRLEPAFAESCKITVTKLKD
jgi:hypothetical protein